MYLFIHEHRSFPKYFLAAQYICLLDESETYVLLHDKLIKDLSSEFMCILCMSTLMVFKWLYRKLCLIKCQIMISM